MWQVPTGTRGGGPWWGEASYETCVEASVRCGDSFERSDRLCRDIFADRRARRPTQDGRLPPQTSPQDSSARSLTQDWRDQARASRRAACKARDRALGRILRILHLRSLRGSAAETPGTARATERNAASGDGSAAGRLVQSWVRLLARIIPERSAADVNSTAFSGPSPCFDPRRTGSTPAVDSGPRAPKLQPSCRPRDELRESSGRAVAKPNRTGRPAYSTGGAGVEF